MTGEKIRREVYLDNSATTPVLPAVAAAMQEMLTGNFGNPSSLHSCGLRAEKAVRGARRVLARALAVEEGEIYFTSGGTEANNLALKGAARRLRRRGKHIITTKIEHPSVLGACRALAAEGFDLSYLDVDRFGLVSAAAVLEALREETILVSVMHVNNETGAILPVAEIGAALKARQPRTLFHVDAVQSFGKLTLQPRLWQADLLSISAHKIHGPKGCGALYAKAGTLLAPLLEGGGQERGLRPGTENTAGIVGFATAARLALARQEKAYREMARLKEMFCLNLQAQLPDLLINGPLPGAAHILNVTIPGIKGEVLLHALAADGIYFSTGAACHARSSEPSHVLQAMGLAPQQIAGALRFSFSFDTTADDTAWALQKIVDAVAVLRPLTGGLK